MLNNIAGALGGGAVALSPVSGMAIWYDANDAGTFTYSSSNIISQWGDKSGNSRNATQATVAEQPTRVTSVINGLPVVRFDGSNDSLGFTNILNSDTSFTIFWVLRPRNVANGYQPSFSSQTSPDADDGALHYINNSNNGASYPFQTKSWQTYDNTNTYVANTSYLMEFIADGSVFKVFRNGTQESTNKNVGSAPAYSQTNMAKQNNPGGRFSAFDFGEVLIYTTALSAGDVTTNRNYLNAKWGL